MFNNSILSNVWNKFWSFLLLTIPSNIIDILMVAIFFPNLISLILTVCFKEAFEKYVYYSVLNILVWWVNKLYYYEFKSNAILKRYSTCFYILTFLLITKDIYISQAVELDFTFLLLTVNYMLEKNLIPNILKTKFIFISSIFSFRLFDFSFYVNYEWVLINLKLLSKRLEVLKQSFIIRGCFFYIKKNLH